MDSHAREKAGFLCRWSLLGLAAATVAVVMWAAVCAASSLGEDLHADVILTDSIWQADGRAVRRVTGYMHPPMRPHAGMVFCAAPRWAECVTTGRRRFKLLVGGGAPGANRVTARGMIHGPLAFRSREAVMVLACPGVEVFLLDARLAGEALAGAPDKLRRLVGELGARGEAAFFHPGPAGAYAEARGALRRAGFSQPVLCELAHGRRRSITANCIYTLRLAARDLGRGRLEHLQVITSDEQLASKATARGFATHLIAPQAAPRARRHRRLRRHGSLEEAKAYLAALPIRH